MENLFRLNKKYKLIFIYFVASVILMPASFCRSLKNYNGLITDGYGIVLEDDLAFDTKHRIIAPYKPGDHNFSIYWQCVPVSQVSPMYRTWRGEDGMGSSNVVVTLCDLEIRLKNKGELHVYCDRRAHEISYCRAFMKNWMELISKEKIVCLNGDLPSYEDDDEDGKYILWTWIKFKTKKGCYSYFADDCDVAGAAKKNKNKLDLKQ